MTTKTNTTATPASTPERAGSIHGVPGRFFAAHAWDAERFSTQTWKSEQRHIDGYGDEGRISVEIRFDDNCKNGHNTFAITADITAVHGRRREWAAGGCMHDEIARVFPELAPLIQWHLTSADGPMHYIANAVYLASNRDHYGLAEGEPSAFDYAVKIGNSPITHRIKKSFWEWLQRRIDPVRDPRASAEFLLQSVHHKKKAGDTYDFAPKYTFVGFNDETWHACPFDSSEEAREWAHALNDPKMTVEFLKIPTQYSKGKPRELDAARNAAVWPDATDEELSVEPAELRKVLEARLPKLLADFRAAVTGAGLQWRPQA
jgi:hypothetical protein